MNNSVRNLGGCAPKQIISIGPAINDMTTVELYNGDCKYCTNELQYSYSVDGVCWSCFMSFDEALAATVELTTDFFLKIKMAGQVTGVTIDGEPTTDYTTQLDSEFSMSDYVKSTTQYNPYSNLEGALSLQSTLNELVSSMFGIDIYYFKLAPNAGSRDFTFKEYALYDVEAVKQIKLMVADGTMPSSKPDFTDFGLEWQSDWEVEIVMSTFATAFGPTAKPMEGDLIYIPMMKRMWMVNEAYDEKNGNLMWTSTTWKLALVKYQEKSSVDLGDTQNLVDTFVKNKYEDLFGEEEGLDSGIEATDSPKYAANNMYAIYESDATRKYVTSAGISFFNANLYYKGTMISDNCYKFNNIGIETQIVYQRKYCGENGVISFIITPNVGNFEGNLMMCANIKINIRQAANYCVLTVINNPKSTLKLRAGTTYFVYLRWSKDLNLIEFTAAPYMYPDSIPMYKLQPHHYSFDLERPLQTISTYNSEMEQAEPKDVIVHGFNGNITNIKVFDIYNDNVSEILQMYPTHQHLMINDTARKILDNHGYAMN